MKLPPWYSREAYEANCAHWERVRAGLYEAEPHIYSTSAEETIEAHRLQARMHIERAADHMRRAEALGATE